VFDDVHWSACDCTLKSHEIVWIGSAVAGAGKQDSRSKPHAVAARMREMIGVDIGGLRVASGGVRCTLWCADMHFGATTKPW
jgi:hypothetical protein